MKVLKRFCFVRYRYSGDSVEVASRKVGDSKMIGYTWQQRWNKDEYVDLIPRYGGGRPSKLTEEQKNELKLLLKERDDWNTNEVRNLINEKFDVKYSLKQVRIILRKFGMKYGKPYPHDYRRPDNAEKLLKKLR